MFRETASGAKTDRSQLRKALDQLDSGDVLMFEIAFISILFRRLKRLVVKELSA